MYKVYIIEDDPMIIKINEKFINKLENFHVIGSSSSGTQALKNINKLKPDLILLDIFMPGMNGIELLKKLRTEDNKYEIIMVTAAQDANTISEALQLGVIDYLIKPYEFSRLQQALDVFINKVTLMKNSATLTQKDLDKINFIEVKNIGSENIESRKYFQEDLPKGLDEITLNKVYTIINSSDEPLSSSSVANLMDVSRITTRKYLEYLVEQNIIELKLKYGHIGRPTKLYQRK